MGLVHCNLYMNYSDSTPEFIEAEVIESKPLDTSQFDEFERPLEPNRGSNKGCFWGCGCLVLFIALIVSIVVGVFTLIIDVLQAIFN